MLDLGRFDILATFIAAIATATACSGHVSGGTTPGSGGTGGSGGVGGSDGCTSSAATCTTGRCLITLASKTLVPADGPYDMPGIAVDATSVYWTSGGEVKKVGLDGGTPITLACVQDPDAIAVDATSVYWTEYGGTVKKLTPK